jgi:hypothetical protein
MQLLLILMLMMLPPQVVPFLVVVHDLFIILLKWQNEYINMYIAQGSKYLYCFLC